MGLENLILEEPAPPTPATPTAGAMPVPSSGPGGASPPFRPTAPGKTSIPWSHDAIGPLSQLARQVSQAADGIDVEERGGVVMLPLCSFIWGMRNGVQVICWRSHVGGCRIEGVHVLELLGSPWVLF